jgi:hypothetical protein
MRPFAPVVTLCAARDRVTLRAMTDTAKSAIVALVVVLLVLLALDVLRRRMIDPIGTVGRSIVSALPPVTVAAPAAAAPAADDPAHADAPAPAAT